jgi:Mn-containing catalase
MMQHLFHGWGSRGPKKYRDIVFDTGIEEISFIEMLSTAIVLNLEAASLSGQEDVARGGSPARCLAG